MKSRHKTTTAPALIVGVLLVPLLAGCMSPAMDAAVGATSAVGLARAASAAEEWDPDAQLLWVHGREAAGIGAAGDVGDGVISAWSYGFYRPSDGGLYEVRVAANGSLEEHTRAPRTPFAAAFAPLELEASVDSATAAARAEATEAFPTPEAGWSLVDYWLVTVDGRPMWTLAYRDAMGGTAAVSVDARDPQSAAPGVAEPPLAFAEARVKADPVAQKWQTDATLVEAVAHERSGGGLQELAFAHAPEPAVPTPPDLAPQDGKAPLWALRYYSASQAQTMTIIVRATATVAAEPRAAPAVGGAPAYAEGVQDVLDSPVAVERAFAEAPEHPDLAAVYLLAAEAGGAATWRVSIFEGDAVSAWVIDAYSGDLIAKAPP